ncbi:DUF5059 domain-containing protein [Halovenus sp. WSH3]|uniref:DUF5059 domain-containing protein n=1 Tax=Halovenus carboxidivorans TaxID=2692199 RepID=A0A6B0T6J6_9EURY|nr:DUF5059 domain-containing protein [Halovenus carboxidivorans]MXR51193.1 DUF5059 domain-containing protein [Halovenus carboxidivorans]
MQQTRRQLLLASGSALAGVSLAGCSGSSDDGDNQSEQPSESTTEQSDSESEQTGAEPSYAAADVGVVSEWNAIRTRLRDPVILGHAGAYDSAATVASDIFERFENASGENNAHETLEQTEESSYHGFEEALGRLRETVANEELEAAHEAMRTADENLRSAQATLADESLLPSLTLLVMGAHVEDGLILLSLGEYGAAAQEFDQIAARFEENLYDGVAEVDRGAADSFVSAARQASSAAESEDREAATQAAHDAFGAALQALYAAEDESVAGAIHMAALQARGWDGAAAAAAGGPTQAFAHAASLNEYRARARDAVLLSENGATEAAVETVQTGLERFETARAHDALEETDHESYESFEGALEDLVTAFENGDSEAATAALETLDSALRSGIAALVSGSMSALLEASYTRIRVADAHEQYRLGRRDRALELVQNVFADFEADAGGFHETLEETDEGLYDTFEHDHLEGLSTAIENGDDEAVASHVAGVHETLATFERQLASTAAASGAEAGYLIGRALDGAALEALGESERASTVMTDALGYFESGAAGFHEALEEADHRLYENFEGQIEAGPSGAESAVGLGVDAIYAVVSASAGATGGAGSIVSDVFAHFEEARVHDLVEEADQESYESYESALESYISALESGENPSEHVRAYAEACLQAQFAVAGAPDKAPANPESSGGEEESEPELEGGPNVVEGVPDDADHVVDMRAVAFDPEELTVRQGDTVAWRHAAGEPHNVVAYEGAIPSDAEYWASGDFDSESAAREGWENGVGAVQSGQSYVRTFDTPGEHNYFCVPHEAAGMVGTIVVEE